MYVDTQTLMWLGAGLTKKISVTARSALEMNTIIIPAMSWLELHFMHEIGRIKITPLELYKSLKKVADIRQSNARFYDITEMGGSVTWTRDPFDRLIVAEALHHKLPLITADKLIRKHCKLAVW